MNPVARAWLEASRPKTLPLAWMAIVVGSLLALAAGSWSWPVLLLSLLTATLLQILSNLANDYGDGLRGVDNAQRLGPRRALQSGLLRPRQLRRALRLVTALSMGSGLALIWFAELDTSAIVAFIACGVLAIIAALTYTLGHRPYGYAGLGDLSVWLFFGLLAVLGSYCLHGAPLTPALLLPASACGLLAVGVLNVNNMRDIDSDRAGGKHTLPVRLGLRQARIYHLLLLLGALLSYLLYLASKGAPYWQAFVFLAAAWPLVRHANAVWQAATPAAMAPLLPAMLGCAVQVNALFAVLLLLPLSSAS